MFTPSARSTGWNVIALLAALAALAVAGCAAQREPATTQQTPPTQQTPRAAESAPTQSDAGVEDDAPSDDAASQAAWDVANPPGERLDVAIDVSEGTWLSLSVSPDGRQIAFDLLGDIYVMPIEGGQARALTTGVAWDMQPRFSPDGRFIAFTSDRGGGDNIWIINRDGSDPQQVTDESYRLLSSPVWTPDSQYIAARKHFTSKRSLGAGEIWLYHRTGGSGAQMVERPTDQKDLGEPAFSPDGRYLYYSLDATPGETFEYNKDSNGQIYAINRLDRETGEIDRFISGAGGSIRPTPSPDGETIAFIRRVRFDSYIYLHNIETGVERPIFGPVERDMQEAWAIHGVYPTMAWSPDGDALYFWAHGKINRLDVATGEARVIPFRVRDTRSVAPAVRFAQDVAPETFHTNAIRWARVSPAGDRVVFEALGKLWIRDLAGGEPRRLTSQEGRFESHPSWSRDGRFIAYATWADDTLGDIRVVRSGGGEGRVVTTSPGHYVEPVISPDNARIVFRKTSGGYITSSAHSRDPGLYVAPFGGGEATLLVEDGAQPHFADDVDRVYFMRIDPGRYDDRRMLMSVGLDGKDEVVHLVSGAAVEYALSPDGKWVAFTERFQTFVAPFVKTGREISVGPESDALPIKKVARDVGNWVHFSGDSRSLHFSLGPELFTRALTDTFAFLEGAPEQLPEPETAGVDIGFDAPYDKPTGSIALVGARIITMDSDDEVIDDGVVVIEGDRIAAVGRRTSVRIPTDAFVLDATGMTIAPGFIDAHAHGGQGVSGLIPQLNWIDYANLAFGVTTIHDPSSDTATIFAKSELAKAGLITAPRTFSTGTILYGASGSFRAEINSLDDARSHLRRLKKVGAFSVKSYNQPRRDQRQQVIQAARELEMLVVPEGGSTFQHNMTMLVDGHTTIEHNIPVANAYDDVLQLWAGVETAYTPTHVVSYGGISGEFYWYDVTDVWKHERLNRFVPRFVIDPRSRRRLKAPIEEYNHVNSARVARLLHDRGVSVNIGAHGQLAGLAAHWEIWMNAQGGMSPLDALKTATIDPAKSLGLEGDLGSIEVGKLADLVVMENNPLLDIRNTDSVRYTMVGGRLYDSTTMDQLAPASNDAGSRRFGDDADAGFADQRLWSGIGRAPAASRCAGCQKAQR